MEKVKELTLHQEIHLDKQIHLGKQILIHLDKPKEEILQEIHQVKLILVKYILAIDVCPTSPPLAGWRRYTLSIFNFAEK